MGQFVRLRAAPPGQGAIGSPSTSRAELPLEGMAVYRDPPPNHFMKQWLICGPFPVRAPAGRPVDETVRQAAFAHDFLQQHGGEAAIQPSAGMAHSVQGIDYTWRSFTASQDGVDLDAVYGRQNDVVVYAAAEIEASAPRTILLGIGADDTAKVWLNGELVHTDWVPGPVVIDQRLVIARLRPGQNRLLFKVIQGDGPWGFACRPLGLEGGAADRLLRRVASEGQVEVARYLLSQGANIHAHDATGWTPLHHAADNGHLALAEFLLAHGADVNARSVDRLTPLHLARRAGFHALSAFLITHGADPRIRPASRPRQIDTLLHIRPDAPGAAVMVIQNGKIRFEKGYGLADLEKKTPITPATPFYLASTGKMFTAMAVMMLAEQGRLHYDDPLSRFFSKLPDWAQQVTVRHLLHHTSGVLDYANDGLVRDTTDLTNRRVFELVRTHELKFPPGERWSYSNSGYVLLAMIVEKVSGQPFRQFVQEQVFGPLGTRHTQVYDETRPPIAGRARGYSPTDGRYRLNDYHQLTTGDGGYFSTVDDLFRWDQSLYGERLVKAETLREAFTAGRLKDGRDCGYGFGWQVWKFRGLNVVSHSGGNTGFRANILRIPSERFTVIFLSNSTEFLPHTLSERIAEIYLWPRMAPREEGQH